MRLQSETLGIHDENQRLQERVKELEQALAATSG
jgi:hypothetical protein